MNSRAASHGLAPPTRKTLSAESLTAATSASMTSTVSEFQPNSSNQSFGKASESALGETSNGLCMGHAQERNALIYQARSHLIHDPPVLRRSRNPIGRI